MDHIKSATLIIKNEQVNVLEYFVMFVFNENLEFKKREMAINCYIDSGKKITINHDRIVEDESTLLNQFCFIDENDLLNDLKNFIIMDYIHGTNVTMCIAIVDN